MRQVPRIRVAEAPLPPWSILIRHLHRPRVQVFQMRQRLQARHRRKAQARLSEAQLAQRAAATEPLDAIYSSSTSGNTHPRGSVDICATLRNTCLYIHAARRLECRLVRSDMSVRKNSRRDEGSRQRLAVSSCGHALE